ncbi:MAG: response regulator transcription factor [Chloroflexi bacterium]|nr:response regulator transcription factor [Chloroflexota bacterium]MCY3916691.1 response regulator transcription factor [Chloroflexota bacterium]
MKRFTVLIIENDPCLRQSIVDFLDSTRYEALAVHDAPPAIEYVRRQGLPSIALIGMQLPSMSGFEIANRLKARADLPVLFLLSSDPSDDIVDGLKTYADDFVVAPFTMRELQTRTEMVLTRVPVIDFDSEPIIFVDENLSIDFAHNRVMVAGKNVGLTPTESILLHVLVRNAPRVVQNRTLLSRAWTAENVFEDTLRVHMHRLRRKLESDSHHPHYIRTERGVGYRFTQRPPGAPPAEEGD